jgi:hypothetical protein
MVNTFLLERQLGENGRFLVSKLGKRCSKTYTMAHLSQTASRRKNGKYKNVPLKNNAENIVNYRSINFPVSLKRGIVIYIKQKKGHYYYS